MKKIIIISGILLTSGIAALSLNKTSQTKIAQAKSERNDFIKSPGYGNFKSDIATAD